MGSAERVAARFMAAGYYDPPDDHEEPPDPSDEWNRSIKAFPPPLRKMLGDPDPEVEEGHEETTSTMTGNVELSEDSGFELSCSATSGVDADEDGLSGYYHENTRYYFWVHNWYRSGKNDHQLKQHLREFINELENKDPEGYKKTGL